MKNKGAVKNTAPFCFFILTNLFFSPFRVIITREYEFQKGDYT